MARTSLEPCLGFGCQSANTARLAAITATLHISERSRLDEARVRLLEVNAAQIAGDIEVMPIGEELKEFVLNGASAAELKREAIRLGMVTLRQSALHKLAEGITTMSEVFRVSAADF